MGEDFDDALVGRTGLFRRGSTARIRLLLIADRLLERIGAW